MMFLTVGICKLWKIVYCVIFHTWMSLTLGIKHTPSILEKHQIPLPSDAQSFPKGEIIVVPSSPSVEQKPRGQMYIHQGLINTFCRNLCLRITIKKHALCTRHQVRTGSWLRGPISSKGDGSNKGDS